MSRFGFVVQPVPRPCAQCRENFTPSVVSAGTKGRTVRMCARCLDDKKKAKRLKKMKRTE